MSLSEFERLLETLVTGNARAMLTLTETPESADELLHMLERAVTVGNRRGAPLVEIHAPIADFPDCAPTFWHVPIDDSSREGVVRLVFERTQLPTAA